MPVEPLPGLGDSEPTAGVAAGLPPAGPGVDDGRGRTDGAGVGAGGEAPLGPGVAIGGGEVAGVGLGTVVGTAVGVGLGVAVGPGGGVGVGIGVAAALTLIVTVATDEVARPSDARYVKVRIPLNDPPDVKVKPPFDASESDPLPPPSTRTALRASPSGS